MEQYMIWIWLFVFVVMFLIEAFTMELVSIWFGIASIVSLCISGISPWWGQLIVFVVVSLVSLILTRPIIKKLLNSREIRKTNSDEFIGQRVKVIKDVDKFDGGEVKINGIIYTAILKEDSTTTIKKDSVVEVVAIKGNRLVIKEIKE